MVDVLEKQDVYQSHFERLLSDAAATASGWLRQIRESAMARFNELGFPTVRDEEWRYTNLAQLAKTAFVRGEDVADEITPDHVSRYRLSGDADVLLVFVNGRFASSLSNRGDVPDGIKIENLAGAWAAGVQSIEPHLAKYADHQNHALTALNTALMEDGSFIQVPAGEVIRQPIHLLYLTHAPDQRVVSHPRTLIVAEANSQVTVVETYASTDEGAYFTNAVTEIVARDGAAVDHYKVQRESKQASHIATLQLYQDRNSDVTSHTLSLGGGLVRNDINAVLDGEGCDSVMNGLHVIDGTQHVDNHLVVEHAKPHCNSREYFKGVLDGQSEGIFSGRIIVREGAQKTDAKQTNMSLLLSEDAQVESKPQLEIFADDVKCTHGATIGQISDEAIFYLRSRGIGPEEARSLLVHAFARETVEQIRVEPLRVEVDRWLANRIGHTHMLRD